MAGSDPGAGAGLQADLRTFQALGIRGATVVTAVTVQGPQGCTAVYPVAANGVRAQARAVLDWLPVRAVKVGMLANASVAGAVADVLETLPPGVPVVLDPVLAATRGRALLDAEGRKVLLARVLPRAACVAPNLEEEAALGGPDLASRCRDLGVALLLKGGHQEGDVLVDRLWMPDGRERTFPHPRIRTRNLHGTGCVLTAALAARLAMGAPLEVAVGDAVTFLAAVLAAGADLDLGDPGPVPVGLVDPGGAPRDRPPG
ncbi:MAG: hydroxymethylpyrimidine/phosphomethylpyrimidine kinase [Deltaproteobacteria bacterium]|nr:hydroxymethylpyrimidine/phosphomethylpyrimidine kinase [Deltaproteobacteria bacterium]